MNTYLGEQTYYVANNYRGYDYGSELPESVNAKAAILPMGGEYFANDGRQKSYNIQNKITYSKEFENSQLNIFLGQEIRSANVVSTSNTVWGYSKERGELLITPTLPADLVPTQGVSATYTGYGVLARIYQQGWKKLNTTNNYISLFATTAYSIKGRYVLNASVRNDWSNRFGQNINRRFDPIYSAGAAWRVANESFIKENISWLSQLNLRVTFGLQGNTLTNQSPELLLVKQGKMDVFNQYYSNIGRIPNPNLQWERTSSWNFGGDISLFDRINLVVDGYRRRSNAVISQEVPLEFGIKNVAVNGGILYNTGIEANLSSSILNKKDIGLSMSINSSKNWNSTGEALMKATLNNYLAGSSGTILKEGVPLNSFWAYSFAGLNPETGSPEFNLMDTDQQIAKEDPSSFLVLIGSKEPAFTGGMMLSFRYKSFTLGSSFSVLLGGKSRLPNPYENFSNGVKLPNNESNLSKLLNDRWKNPGDEQTTNIPSLSVNNTSIIQLPNGESSYLIPMWALSDIQVVESSFLRMKGIDLSWRLNSKLLKNIPVNNISLNASVNNIFVIASKRFQGMDPEFGTSTLPRTYSLGVSIGL